MNYRSLAISDYQQLVALWRDCEGISLREADSQRGIEKYLLRNPGLSFVAVEQDRLCGTVMAGHDGKRGYIQHLAVAAAYRQRGVGSKLVDLSLAALKAEGIVKSHVHVIGSNQAGRQFWINRAWIPRDEIALYSIIDGGGSNA